MLIISVTWSLGHVVLVGFIVRCCWFCFIDKNNRGTTYANFYALGGELKGVRIQRIYVSIYCSNLKNDYLFAVHQYQLSFMYIQLNCNYYQNDWNNTVTVG